MAAGELTGADPQELAEMEFHHQSAPLWQAHRIPFETAYCLAKIGRQPEEYDGPQRHCKRRAAKLSEDEWAERHDDEYNGQETRAYHPRCQFHGRSCNGQNSENLVEPGFANLKHGMYAEDWRLKADFSDADELMFDYIMSWAEIYGWPERAEDPARYDILEQLAYDRVRTLRAEEYFEEVAAEHDGQSEIEYRAEYDAQGVQVGEYPVPNALSEDLRLLRKEIVDLMTELGLTPKSRGKMDMMESETSSSELVAELAAQALSGEQDYDPGQFSEESEEDANE